jgi:hypothetical protein
MKRRLSLSMLLLSGCYLAHELEGGAAVEPPARLVWVVVHPSDAPLGAGVYLFDEASQEIVRQLGLPDGVTSPHALAYDGVSLWLGGVDSVAAVRELDPMDGGVRSEWRGVVTEGIATDGETFWYTGVVSALSPLVHVERDGTQLSSTTLSEVTVQDLVSASGALYYLVNDDVARIVQVDPTTGAASDLVRGVHDAPYSLGFDGRHLVVAGYGRARRFDPTTGAFVGETAFGVPGWITAIAYVR